MSDNSSILNDLRDWLKEYHNYWATYHNHKEQMAFAAIGLYLAGTTALVFVDFPEWAIRPQSRLIAFLVTASLSALLGLFYTGWQLNNRTIASEMETACALLLMDLQLGSDKSADLERKDSRYGFPIPNALITKLDAIHSEGPWFKREWFNRVLLAEAPIYFILGIWAALPTLRFFQPLPIVVCVVFISWMFIAIVVGLLVPKLLKPYKQQKTHRK